MHSTPKLNYLSLKNSFHSKANLTAAGDHFSPRLPHANQKDLINFNGSLIIDKVYRSPLDYFYPVR